MIIQGEPICPVPVTVTCTLVNAFNALARVLASAFQAIAAVVCVAVDPVPVTVKVKVPDVANEKH